MAAEDSWSGLVGAERLWCEQQLGQPCPTLRPDQSSDIEKIFTTTAAASSTLLSPSYITPVSPWGPVSSDTEPNHTASSTRNIVTTTASPSNAAFSSLGSQGTTPVATIASSSKAASSSGHSNTKTTVAIAVPVVIVSVALIAALIFLLLRRRRKANNTQTPSGEMSHEAGTAFLPRNEGDLRQTGISPSVMPNIARRNSIARRPVTHNYNFALNQNAESESGLMESPAQSPNIPAEPPRYSAAISHDADRDGNQSVLTSENLAALDWRESGEGREERTRSPFEDPSDGTVSVVSDMATPAGGHARDADEASVVSSLSDEHGKQRAHNATPG